jgi:hypothetical protein
MRKWRQGVRVMGVRRRRKLVVVMVASLVSLPACLGIVSPAWANEPTGDFAVFKQCPRFTPGVELCLYSQLLSGELAIGKQVLPVLSPVTLQGGIAFNEATFAESFVGALNGETISRTPQSIPGGLTGLIDCEEIGGKGSLERARRRTCRAVLQNDWLTAVSATIELARPANEIVINTANAENAVGTALSLPLRIHLENPLLGRECYIGSSASPIAANLTSGTTSPPEPNKPISGKIGVISAKDEFNFIELTENTLVDNAFSVPSATGCGGYLSFIIDPLIDSKLGLPSPAGNNTDIQNNTTDEATTVGVIASEQPTPPSEERGHGHGRGPGRWRRY